MAPKQRRRTSRGARKAGPPPAPGPAAPRKTTQRIPVFTSGRRLLYAALGALVATSGIAVGLITLVRSGSATTGCDPDASGWNGAGAGPANTADAPSAIKDPGPTWAPQWSYAATAPPAVAGGTVYTATSTGTLVALDARTGALQWTSDPQQNEQGQVATPIAVDGCAAVVATTYTGADGQPAGTLRAIDLRTHQRRWGVPTADEIFSAPQVVDGVAYAGLSFATGTGSLDRTHVLDGYYLSDGTRAYRKSFSAAVTASPTSDHQRIWIGDLDQNLYALGPQGTQLWTYTTAGIVSLPAVYDGSSVIVASADHHVASLDPGTGHEHWNVAVGDVQAAMATSGDVVVVAESNGTVHALRRSDGTQAWTTPLHAQVTRGVVAAGDRIFVADDGGTLHVLDRATGVETARWTAPAPPTGPPAIAENHLYVACQDGRLYALPL
ncbi:MAG TPA: PQQ-binding-like beta-propeller repeat protein [Candidatus Dormibacteraeota bacterium]|nr:PQQ-binding-like beta-propeller repeat protein [Candidatus Dormibacteraeota bacterium]